MPLFGPSSGAILKNGDNCVVGNGSGKGKWLITALTNEIKSLQCIADPLTIL